MANGLVPDTCFPYYGHKSCPKCPDKCVDDGRPFKTAHTCKCQRIQQCRGTAGEQMTDCVRAGGSATFNIGVCPSFLTYQSGLYTCDCTEYIGRHNMKAVGTKKIPCTVMGNNNWGSSWGNKGLFYIACDTCDFVPGQTCDQFVKPAE